MSFASAPAASAPGTPSSATAEAVPEASEAVLQRVAELVRSSSATTALTQIGHYRLQEIIGEGGMGVVFRAEQLTPIRRTVALKLIKPGMTGREVLARFQSERQALALMNHPHLARVLDAGTTDTGRPYFVMEYVPGEPITRFCDRHQLTIQQRLELFIQACHAVQHAHQKAIIHRDLKPSNILVMLQDERPCVKVIDFGVAKALGEGLADQTLCTQSGQLIGTPEYMSPEQARGEATIGIDTRTDIYSLGVVLYELLVGALPFDPRALRSSGLLGLERTICRVDPPRPSTRLSKLGSPQADEVAQRRQTHVAELVRQLSQELEWIPLKAMRKEPDRRYATASALAEDIHNYLAHKPLSAGPESRAYRLKKFVRRRRVESIAALLVVLSVLTGLIATTTFAIRESRQRVLAEQRAYETNRVAEFQGQMLRDIDVQLMGARLREDVLSEAESNWRQSRLSDADIAARRAQLEALLNGANFANPAIRSLDRNILERSYQAIQDQFADQPLVKARLLQQLAVIARNLTLLERAGAAQSEALDIRERELGPDHPDTLLCRLSMGLLLAAKGNWVEAEPYARDVLNRAERVLGADDLLTLRSKKLMAEVLQRQWRLFEAEPYRWQTLESCRRVLGEDHRDTLDAVVKYGQVLLWQGRLDEAEVYIVQAAQDACRVRGEDDQQTIRTIAILGALREAQGRLSEAEACFRQAYEGIRLAVGDDDRESLYALLQIGSVLRLQGRFVEAESYLQRALEACKRVLGEDHRNTVMAIRAMGFLRRDQGKLPEAEQLLRQALRYYQAASRYSQADGLFLMQELGDLLQRQERWSEAEPVFAELYAQAARAQMGARSAARYMSYYGPCLLRLNHLQEAETALREAHNRLMEFRQDSRTRLPVVVEALAELCDKTDRPDEAAHWRAELQELRAATQPTSAAP